MRFAAHHDQTRVTAAPQLDAFEFGAGAAAVTRAPRAILPVIRWGAVKPYVEDYATPSRGQLQRVTAGCARLWFISSHEGDPDGPVESLRHRAGYYRLDAELERMFGHAPTAKFGYAAVIHVQLLPGRTG